MNEDRSTRIRDIADTLRVAASMQLGPNDAHQLMPGVLARLLNKQQHDPRDFMSYDFEKTLAAVVGQALIQEAPRLLLLADKLQALGATPDAPYDFGYVDKYGSLLLNEKTRKAMAFETQNVNYLVFMKKKYNGWSLHLRRWYKELDTDTLNRLTDRYAPTIEGIMRLAGAVAAYADDTPGNSYPRRLSLRSFVQSNFNCWGLRYLDIRDAGYLASAELSPFDEPSCDKVSSTDLGTLHYAWYDLLSVVDTLVGREEDPSQ